MRTIPNNKVTIFWNVMPCNWRERH